MVDIALYAILDPERAGGHALPALARAVVAGGATVLQLRDKRGSTRAMVESARAIKAAAPSVPLLINDRADVAFAAGADGVHVGQDDLAPADARRLLGPDAIIGLSIKTMEEAHVAPLHQLQYVCIGGVFTTSSKENTNAPIGVAGLRERLAVFRARAPGFPVGAIAGIDASNAASVMETGVDGVAVISALSLQKDPTAAARDLRARIDAARVRR